MYQPSVDWNIVKQHRDFAYIKATEGGGYVDPYFTRHRNGAMAAGLPLGAYHYLQTGNGTVQAQNFLRATNNYSGFNLPVAVDFEQNGVNATIANDFIREIERVIGRPWVGRGGTPVACVFYTGNYFMPNGRDASWDRMDLWVAAYTNRNYPNPGPEPQFLPVPGAVFPWREEGWSIWQCNGGDGRCPGVGGGHTPCDQNVATVEWFNRTLQVRPTPTPTPTPIPEDEDMTTLAEVQQEFVNQDTRLAYFLKAAFAAQTSAILDAVSRIEAGEAVDSQEIADKVAAGLADMITTVAATEVADKVVDELSHRLGNDD